MTVRIRYFAWIREGMGRTEETRNPADGVKTVSDLIEQIITEEPEAKAAFTPREHVRAALDDTLVPLDAPLGSAREVSFFPPMTGG